MPPASEDLLSFATPVLIDSGDRADRLGESLAELRRLTGREVQIGTDVELIRPLTAVDPGLNGDHGRRVRLDAHLRAARLGRERGIDRLLVLEDDVEFDRNWPEVGPDALNQLDELDWDVATLGHEGIADHDEVAFPTARWARLRADVGGGNAYLLSRHFFDRWIGHLESLLGGAGSDRHGVCIDPDGAINVLVAADPLTMRYVAVPRLVDARRRGAKRRFRLAFRS